MSLPVAGVGGCTELSASPLSQESLRRLPWCTCVSASASQSRAQCKKERKKTDNPREGWEDGTPPPHRDFKERGVER